MANSDFIDVRKLLITPFQHPFHPEGETGDSGAMEFAVAKDNPDEQYVIKRTYPELACNEFMYHKVTEQLGLYTQDVKLISWSADYRRSAAIRYVQNAKVFDVDESDGENFKAYFMFKALNVILNEYDGCECYLDGQGRLFKLDNASSFTVNPLTIAAYDGKPIKPFTTLNVISPLFATDYEYYATKHKWALDNYGSEAAKAYLSAIERFAELDGLAFFPAYKSLQKHYPKKVSEHYMVCIHNRMEACQRYVIETKNRAS